MNKKHKRNPRRSSRLHPLLMSHLPDVISDMVIEYALRPRFLVRNIKGNVYDTQLLTAPSTGALLILLNHGAYLIESAVDECIHKSLQKHVIQDVQTLDSSHDLFQCHYFDSQLLRRVSKRPSPEYTYCFQSWHGACCQDWESVVQVTCSSQRKMILIGQTGKRYDTACHIRTGIWRRDEDHKPMFGPCQTIHYPVSNPAPMACDYDPKQSRAVVTLRDEDGYIRIAETSDPMTPLGKWRRLTPPIQTGNPVRLSVSIQENVVYAWYFLKQDWIQIAVLSM